ncbi:serine hydrolase [Dyadobacter alkalitolerans]|uniref:serine hydrolase n=1 Tax=Dyadobacter alkalitolerans TaxID=492736 RepID=UPI0035B67E1A
MVFKTSIRKKPVTAETVFHIASISKTVTAAAIMQINAKGYFNLDDDINRFLPFRVVNPSLMCFIRRIRRRLAFTF